MTAATAGSLHEDRPKRWRGFALPKISALHLTTLFTLAVAHPLYDVLGNDDHAPFFQAHHAQAVDVWLLVFVSSLFVPAALFLVLWLLNSLCRPLARGLNLFLLFVLFAAFFLPVPGKFVAGSGSLGAVLGLAAAGLATLLYLAASWTRSLVSFMSLIVLVSPTLFLTSGSIRLLFSAPEARDYETAAGEEAKPNVVVIVFDELPLTSLLNEHRQIDAVRYPNFARLAETSTWYRNASSVHWSTTHAVPAIFYGKFPWRGRRGNIFTLLERTHEILAITTYREVASKKEEVRSYAPKLNRRFSVLLEDISLLYGHIVIPEPLRNRLPGLGTQWAHFLRDDTAGALDDADWPYTGAKPARTKQFVDLLARRDNPVLYYLHTVFPHEPYEYNFLGQRHDRRKLRFEEARKVTGANPGPSEMEVDLTYQAHLLQVSFADLLLGRILDKLRALDLFEDALILVTADHGITFFWNEDLSPEEFRRVQASDIMYVPFLVKAPRQDQGLISDDIVETMDVVPTLADMLGMSVPFEFDGVSVLAQAPPGRVRVAHLPERTEFGSTIDPEYASLKRKLDLFGSGSFDSIYAYGPHPEAVTKSVESFPFTDATVRAIVRKPAKFRNVDPTGPMLPAYIEGKIAGVPPGLQPGDLALAVAVNGIIRGTTKVSEEEDGTIRFVVRVAPESFVAGENKLTIHAIVRDELGQAASLVNFR